MLFTLEVLPAQEGDCLLLHYGTKAKPKLAVIDGGPGTVYDDTLEPRLRELLAKRGTPTLVLDWVMVSHVDNDHVVGIRKLFRDIENGHVPFQPRRLWHNTFNDIVGDERGAYFKTLASMVTASANGASLDASVTKDLLAARKKKYPEETADDAARTTREIAAVLAGQADGRALRNSYEVIRAANPGALSKLNSPFNALISDASKPAKLDELSVRILGPTQEQIKALAEAFDAYLTERHLTAALAAYVDDSVTNLSSLVCLVTSGKKKLLLTGDARGDFIVAALKKAKLAPLKVDVFKVPHHGSVRNAAKDLFENVVADTYVFSGNGDYGNPDRETLEFLFDSRPAKDRYDVVFTYGIDEIDSERRKVWGKAKANKGKTWPKATEAIATLLAERKAAGFAFRVVEGAPVKIELGEKSP